jgi:SHS2 domain-containing protein
VPFEFVEDGATSDTSFRAWGDSLEEAFAAAVDATTGAMVEDVESVRPIEDRRVAVRADSLDLALRRLLGEVVFLKDAEGLLVRATEVAIDQAGARVRAVATLRGERIDPSRHALGSDVKAVTLHGLAVIENDDGWEATVTLDI